MKRIVFTFLLILLFWDCTTVASAEITPSLSSRMLTEQKVRVIIRMKERIDTRAMSMSLSALSKAEKRSLVMTTMKTLSAVSQTEILRDMTTMQNTGDISGIKQYWIGNVIICEATPNAIRRIALRDDVEKIDIDAEAKLIDYNPTPVTASKGIAKHLEVVKAIEANENGYEGEGVIVAVLDTGVNYDHNDIKDLMWTTDEFPNHGYDFVNNDNDPKDDNGHGSHCAGIIAGNGASGTRTGVAPKANIMALKVLNAEGSGTQSYTWDAIEFAAEHGASLLSFSAGWVIKQNPDKETWRDVMENLQDLGILMVVAAGNEGASIGSAIPIPNNVRTPGNCPAAWLHPEQENPGRTTGIITIGATIAAGNQLLGMSSRGPSTWQDVTGYEDYPYNPGSGLTKPDVIAPGDAVISLGLGVNNYVGMSGTSMATPCVAGIVALMLSKNPELTPAQIVQNLSETARKLTPTFNNATGAGCTDALAVTYRVSNPTLNCTEMKIIEKSGYADGKINLKDKFALNLVFQNSADVELTNVDLKLSVMSNNLTIKTDSIRIDKLNVGETNIENCFDIQVADGVKIGDKVTCVLTITDGNQTFFNSFDFVIYDVMFQNEKYQLTDTEGNIKEDIKKGETAILKLPIKNIGNEVAYNVVPKLTIDSKYIEVVEPISPQKTNIEQEMAFAAKITVSNQVPTWHYATIKLDLKGDNIDTTYTYKMNIGKTAVLIVDMNQEESANRLIDAFSSFPNISYQVVTRLPDALTPYESVLCLSDNTLSIKEIGILTDYIDNGGRLYVEGSSLWGKSQHATLAAKFHVSASGLYSGGLKSIVGIDPTFTKGMSFEYSLPIGSVDKLTALETAYPILKHVDPEFNTAIAYSDDNSKTIAASFEIGGILSENIDILKAYLDFFGIDPNGVGIESVTDPSNDIIVFPNPSKGAFSIKGDFDSYEIININGATIYSSTISPSIELTQGVYLIRVKIAGQEVTKKLIVTE